ncbi:pyridoxamine 5'-phosphate oxidase family protein [Williamsia phyllosphaerae]|uniref:Phosphohydrolase n=1 Tax=Williamsia phyllosphaerae TaxID=885042 RepID=A0ABQ1V2N1_9NOCA|nr:pyridoxamine 5'-phosphate oxidase family protein [Williamsia phyllosphaerae]GGF33130.1 phosphohydrolase [Williamsia phyllosphaerae]
MDHAAETVADAGTHTVDSLAELRAIVGHPNQRVADKVAERLSEMHREWIAHCPFVVLATTDAVGNVDVSPKGDPPGFVHVLDDTTIAIPERPGNKRVDGYSNILDNPHVGALFVVPGRGDTLRVNGVARIVSDAPYFDDMIVAGNRPILALEVSVRETFFHCAKAFMRSALWKPETWEPGALPSTAQIAHAVMPGPSLEEYQEHYRDENYRAKLY